MGVSNQKIIGDIIQKLRSIDDQWESYVLNEDKNGDNKLISQIQFLYDMLHQELKEADEEEVREFLIRQKLKKETVDTMLLRTEGLLQFYRAFSFLRELESEDPTALKGILSGIYQKHILRFEPGYLRYIAGGKYDEEVLENIAHRIDFLTNYYVCRSFTMQGMLNDLKDETGLSDDNCEYWADLIDRNYQILKMNYIMDELRELRKKVEL